MTDHADDTRIPKEWTTHNACEESGCICWHTADRSAWCCMYLKLRPRCVTSLVLSARFTNITLGFDSFSISSHANKILTRISSFLLSCSRLHCLGQSTHRGSRYRLHVACFGVPKPCWCFSFALSLYENHRSQSVSLDKHARAQKVVVLSLVVELVLESVQQSYNEVQEIRQ